EDFSAIEYRAVARARGRQRRAQLPFVGVAVIDMMEVRIGVEGIDAAADQVNLSAGRDDAGVIARGVERRAILPFVRRGIIGDVPVDRLARGEAVADRAADGVNAPAIADAGGGTAGF